MEVKNHIVYNIEKSAERIQEILDSNNSNYEEKGNVVPSRDTLTYDNGYYVNVGAIFVDIVGSSDLSDGSQRATLAKIYRSFISECVAIMSSKKICKEVNIHGDCVWGIYELSWYSNADVILEVAATIRSFINLLNKRLIRKGYKSIDIGIGIDYGRALMIKAGYKGSSINEVVWMGDVVNNACHLANTAGRSGRSVFIVSDTIYKRLSVEIKQWFKKYSDWTSPIQYEGDVCIEEIEDWIKNH